MDGSKLVGRIELDGSVSIARPRRYWRPRRLLLLQLAELQRYFIAHGTPDAAGAMQRAAIAVGDMVRAQATYMGYAGCFALLGAVLLCAVFAVAMLRKGAAATAGAH